MKAAILILMLAGCACQQPVEYRYNHLCQDSTGHWRFGNPFAPYQPTPYKCQE